jgi:hypothetical protein
MPKAKSEQQLVELLEKNYQCLHRQYRLGRFEGSVAYASSWGPDGDGSGVLFYRIASYLCGYSL